ncbi:MAG: tape measure protein, partial [Lachnospiraceae bacterium]|nr:tape measure protein [Lachnospiraceae bacterium]
GIHASIQIHDGMTVAFQNMTTALNICLNTFEAVQTASSKAIDTASIDAARNALADAELTIREVEDNLKKAKGQQDKLNDSMQRGQNAADGLSDKIIGFVAAYASIQTVAALGGMSDGFTQITARLSMMNKTFETTEELQQAIFQSAQASRADYTATADAVAKLGNNAADAFDSTQEIVRFSELVNKQFTIAGASSQEASNAFLQLTQAMGSGVLRGDELNSIFEQAPNLIQNIAAYIEKNEAVAMGMAEVLGISYDEMSENAMGHIRELASQGAITSDIIKNAMFTAADEIDTKFEEMSATWGQAVTGFKNDAMMELQPLLARINELANDAEFQDMLQNAVGILGYATDAGIVLIDIFQAGIEQIQPFAPYFLTVAAVIGAVVLATKLWAGAQMLVNIAMSPLGVAALVIVGLIAVVYLAVHAFNSLADTSYSATGIIMGAFATAGAYIANTFIVPTWNKFAMLANFFANVWNDPVNSVLILFDEMLMFVVGVIQKIATALEFVINAIPGAEADFTSGLNDFYNDVKADSERWKSEGEWVEVVKTMDYIDYDAAWDAGYDLGAGIDSSIGGFDLGDIGSEAVTATGDYDLDMSSNLADIASSTSDISDALEITEEDLKYLMELGERDAINRFTTAEIKVDLGGVVNQVSSNADLDGMIDYLAGSLEEQMAIMADGVH